MHRNERGLTLVEVLLTLALLSVVSLLIWGVFFQGAKFSTKAVSKNQMQQEANAISTYLTRVHQTSDNYSIEIKDEQLVIIFTKDGDSLTQTFHTNHLTYNINAKKKKANENEISVNSAEKINPNEYDIRIIVTISDKNDANNNISIETVLSRLKNEGGSS